MLWRIAVTIIVFISLVLAPYWLFLGVLILACMVTPLYIEGAGIALLHDAFFSASGGSLFGFRSVTFLIIITTIGLVYMLRTIFRKRI